MSLILENHASFESSTDGILISKDSKAFLHSSLPWATVNQQSVVQNSDLTSINTTLPSGEFILSTLFMEFSVQCEKKVEIVMAEPMERPLSKSLARGEDSHFDQLLSTLCSVAEHCLTSLLRHLFSWYDFQSGEHAVNAGLTQHPASKDRNKDFLLERRDLALEFLFALILLEILKQLPLHPVPDPLLSRVEKFAFGKFRPTPRDGAQASRDAASPNSVNINLVADLNAELVGVLAVTRYTNLKRLFEQQYNDLKCKELSDRLSLHLVSLIMGMRFYRVKMFPVEAFVDSFSFLQECSGYLLESKGKVVKHALAGLMVEILAPIAAKTRTEVNIPCVKNFVTGIYQTTFEWSNKTKHRLALYPLVTCILSVATKDFFLSNWYNFANNCLTLLKSRDVKTSRVALESLYRLVWVYVVREGCESNATTHSRLYAIINGLFPKNSRNIIPKDAPLNIFVKIIHFISQEKLDFVLKDVIYDLLCVNRKFQLNAERMNIGLRAFLVIADSLQQKDNPPAMPTTSSYLPSGCVIRIKKSFLASSLTEEIAKDIGLSSSYINIRKALGSMLRALDIGLRHLLTSNMGNKELDDVITVERKPKLDLFRTCIAAMPRILPDGMTKQEILALLTMLTIHIDEELRSLAYTALQTLMTDFADWREDILASFVTFTIKEIPDAYPTVLDSSIRLLSQFCTVWRNSVEKQDNVKTPQDATSAIESVEGLALVSLCSLRPITRRLCVILLKETKQLSATLQLQHTSVIDVLDSNCSSVLDSIIGKLPPTEGLVTASAGSPDIQWLADRTSHAWATINYDNLSIESSPKDQIHTQLNLAAFDAWSTCLAVFFSQSLLPLHCYEATCHTWSFVLSRLQMLYNSIDPTSPTEISRAPLRNTKRQVVINDILMQLWRNYVTLASASVPPPKSPSLTTNEATNNSSEHSQDVSNQSHSPVSLVKMLIPMLKLDNGDIRDAVVYGLGFANLWAIKHIMNEIPLLIKESIEKKQENVRRRKKRNDLRLALVTVLEQLASRGVFAQCPSACTNKDGQLTQTLIDYINGTRLVLDTEAEKDTQPISNLKLKFTCFVRKLIASLDSSQRAKLFPRELQRNLFYQFANWSDQFGSKLQSTGFETDDQYSCKIELEALRAMSAVACCGKLFDESLVSPEGSFLFHWLDGMMKSTEVVVISLANETIDLLLRENCDNHSLIEWIIDRCYTGKPVTSDACFLALSHSFSRPQDVDIVLLVCVSLLKCNSPKPNIREPALFLFQSLDLTIEKPKHLNSGDVTPKEGANQRMSMTLGKSNMYLSTSLSRDRPELTLAVFSELTMRMEAAQPENRKVILELLLPWIFNIELIPFGYQLSSNRTSQETVRSEGSVFGGPLVGGGWGSVLATELVLNNLFYIQVVHGNQHPKEMEDLWRKLTSAFQSNLRVILGFLMNISTAPSNRELLPHAKRVIVYMAKAIPDRLMVEISLELHSVDYVSAIVERTDTVPYYEMVDTRKNSMSVGSSTASSTTVVDFMPKVSETLFNERWKQHTKSASVGLPEEIRCSAASGTNSLNISIGVAHMSTSSCTNPSLNGTLSGHSSPTADLPLNFSEWRNKIELHGCTPSPLPLPTSGGYCAPLAESLCELSSPSQGLYKCNIALILITDLIIEDVDIDWNLHLPLLLHVSVLGLDHNRLLAFEHCKKVILNLIQVLVPASMYHFITGNILNHTWRNLPAVLNITEKFSLRMQGLKLTDDDSGISSPKGEILNLSEEVREDRSSIDTTVSRLLECLSERTGQPMWVCEDITPKQVNIVSYARLSEFVDVLTEIFAISLPGTSMKERWGRTALQHALSTTSRHYAGRSFQVFRALKIPLCHTVISDMVTRLVETIGDTSDEIQGYMTEIMMTLDSALDNLPTDLDLIELIEESNSKLIESERSPPYNGRKSPSSEVKPLNTDRKSPNLPSILEKRDSVEVPVPNVCDIVKRIEETHKQTLSEDVPKRMHSLVSRKLQDVSSRRRYSFNPSLSLQTDDGTGRNMTRSAVNLSHRLSHYSTTDVSPRLIYDERQKILGQLFWIAVSILESDFEQEFQMALKLLKRVVDQIELGQSQTQKYLQSLANQMKWPDFPGVQALLLKGLTLSSTYDTTIQLVSDLSRYSQLNFIDPIDNRGLPMNICALLPVLVSRYSSRGQFTDSICENIEFACTKSPFLRSTNSYFVNIATMMEVYKLNGYHKDAVSWVQAVSKYLAESFPDSILGVCIFLIEIIEKGPFVMQQPHLQVLHSLLTQLDICFGSPQVVNSLLIRSLNRMIQGSNWKDVLKTIKYVIMRSSSLVTPTPSIENMTLTSTTAFEDRPQLVMRRELPGRTMTFEFDVSSAPLLGQKLPSTGILSARPKENEEHRRGVHVEISPQSGLHFQSISPWRKPQQSQRRTKERLVAILACFGENIGLPHSPSVLFSSTSDIVLERQNSLYSNLDDDNSGGESSNEGVSPGDQFAVFRDFDFLDVELDSGNDEGGNFNWGVRRQSVDDDLEDDRSYRLSLSPSPNHPGSSDEEDESTTRSISPPTGTSLTPNTVLDFPFGLIITPVIHGKESLEGISPAKSERVSPALLSNHGCKPEEIWRSHASAVMAGGSTHQTLNSFLLFSRLFRSTKPAFVNLVQLVCQRITRESVSSHFLKMLATADSQLDCAFVYLSGVQLPEQLKFQMLEIGEHWDTYSSRVEIITKILDTQSSDQELAHGLYKLFFQRIMLFKSFNHLLYMFNKAYNQSSNTHSEVVDVSQEVSTVRATLLAVLTQPRLPNVTASPSGLEKSIAAAIGNMEYVAALTLVSNSNQLNPMLVNEGDDIDYILWVYARSLTDSQVAIAVSKSPVDTNEVCTQLMEMTKQLMTVIISMSENERTYL